MTTGPRATPRVSVVIPVKDDRAPLERCLRALAEQTVPPDEVIVVDNGSHDGSAALARAAGARVVTETDPGIPAASAAGFDAARYEVIGRLDADTVPSARWVETVVASFSAHPDVDAVTGSAVFADGPEVLRRPLAALYLGSYFMSLLPALGHVPLFGSNLAVRREAWRAVRDSVHLDQELHDDLDLSFHLGGRRRIRFERRLEVTISQRPLWSWSSLVRRFRRGFGTVFLHWPAELPWLRWQQVVRSAVLRRRERERRRGRGPLGGVERAQRSAG